MEGIKKGSHITITKDFVLGLNNRIRESVFKLCEHGYHADEILVAVPDWLLRVMMTMPYYAGFRDLYEVFDRSKTKWLGCQLVSGYRNEIAIYHKDMPFEAPELIQIIQIEQSTQ